MANKTHTTLARAAVNGKRFRTYLYTVEPHMWPDGLETSVRYRGSQVAVVYDDHVTVSSCGWATHTTKAVINAVLEAADTDVRIVQRKFDWYLVGAQWDGSQFAPSFTPYDYHALPIMRK